MMLSNMIRRGTKKFRSSGHAQKYISLALFTYILFASIQIAVYLKRVRYGDWVVETSDEQLAILPHQPSNKLPHKEDPIASTHLQQEQQRKQKIPVLFGIAPEQRSGEHTIQKYKFDIANPKWPEQPPTPRSDCQVKFKDPNFQICLINPYGPGGNFGDELGPPIVKRILELAFGCSAQDLPTFDLVEMLKLNQGFASFSNRTRPCLMTVGSLWGMVRSGDHLWGTGAANEPDIHISCARKAQHNLTVHSSRGPKSAQKIRDACRSEVNTLDGMETAGDAGFLIPYLFPEIRIDKSLKGTKDLCIIAHAMETGNKRLKSGGTTGHRLSVAQPWEKMVRDLQECDKVVSSSLHGIILSEALQIPNRHLGLTKKPGFFKFGDFHESLRGVEEPELMRSIENATTNLIQPISKEESEEFARRVLRSFPIHLFDVEFADEKGRLRKQLAGSKDLTIQ